MNRLLIAAVLVLFAAAAVFGGRFFHERSRRAVLDQFGRLNAELDCCVSAADPRCSRAVEQVRELARGSDDVAYVARTQYIAQCPVFGVVKPAPPPPPPPAAPAPIAAPVAVVAPPAAVEEPESEPSEEEDEGDGDGPAYSRDVPSAVVEIATGRRIPLGDEAGWQAVALTGADGGLAGIAYEQIAEDSGCESARVALLGPGGGFDRFVLSNGQFFFSDGKAIPLKLADGLEQDASRHTARWGAISIADQRVSVGGVEILHGCSLGPVDGGTAATAYALVAPDGSLQPIPSVPLK